MDRQRLSYLHLSSLENYYYIYIFEGRVRVSEALVISLPLFLLWFVFIKKKSFGWNFQQGNFWLKLLDFGRNEIWADIFGETYDMNFWLIWLIVRPVRPN